MLAWVLRAGVVARERVTPALDGRDGRDGREDGRDLPRVACDDRERLAVRVWVRRLAEREGFGLRDEDFTDYLSWEQMR